MSNELDKLKQIEELNNTIKDINSKKAKAILELGIYVYQLLRDGAIKDEDIDKKCEPIIGFDHILYDSKIKVENLRKEIDGYKCDCGATVNYDDKFCGVCGKKVEIPKDTVDYISCSRCFSEIDKNSKYCPCCGIKL